MNAAPQPPPFRLLGIHFLAPRVLAVAHVITLGVITTSIVGALYQFYPMALGAMPYARIARHRPSEKGRQDRGRRRPLPQAVV